MDEITLIILGAFGAAVMIIFVLARAVLGSGKDTKLHNRLVANAAHDPQRDSAATGGVVRSQTAVSGVAPIVQRIGQAAAKPFMPNTREKQSSLRKKLGHAGIYS